MVCSNCGWKNPEYRVTCEKCGESLGKQVDYPPRQPTVKPEAAKESNSLGKAVRGTLVSFALLILGVVATIASDNAIYVGAITVGGIYFLIWLVRLIKIMITDK